MPIYHLTWFGSLCVFFSGYAPLGLMVLVVDFDYEKWRPDHPWLCCFLVLFFALCCVVTAKHLSHYPPGTKEMVETIRPYSFNLLTYTVPYIVLLSGPGTSDFRHLGAVAALLLFMCFLVHKTRTVLVHPFLLFLGYKVNEVTVIYRTGSKEKCLVLSKGQPNHGHLSLYKTGDGFFIASTDPS